MWTDVKTCLQVVFVVLSLFSIEPNVHVPKFICWKVKNERMKGGRHPPQCWQYACAPPTAVPSGSSVPLRVDAFSPISEQLFQLWWLKK